MNKYKLILLFVLSFLVCGLQAEQLYFPSNETHTYKIAETHSYKITQSLEESTVFPCLNVSLKQSDSIIFDMTVHPSVSENSSYPYTVEIVVRQIKLDQACNEAKLIIDSSNPSVEHRGIYMALDKIIGKPLLFEVNDDFNVIETTGLLEQVEEDIEKLDRDLLVATSSSFRFILRQFFHLSGIELQPGIKYPLSCSKFLDWEDDDYDREDLKVDEDSNITIKSIQSDKIQGSWIGNAKIENEEFKRIAQVRSRVSWSRNNALEQNRHIHVYMKENYDGEKVEVTLQQTWETLK